MTEIIVPCGLAVLLGLYIVSIFNRNTLDYDTRSRLREEGIDHKQVSRQLEPKFRFWHTLGGIAMFIFAGLAIWWTSGSH